MRMVRSTAVWGLALTLVVAACSPNEPNPAATETVTAVPAHTAPSATSVPSPSLTPTVACSGSTPSEVEATYNSPLQGVATEILVYLPPCYPEAGMKYPAVYLLHGKPYDETHWASLGLAEALERNWRAGAPKAIYFLPHAREPLFSSSDGGPGSYEQEFLEGVIPYAETNFPIADGANSRALAGISRGGVWALEIGLSHPDRFGTVAAISPALSVNYPRPQYDPFQLAMETPALPSTRFLLAGGTDWARPGTERLAAMLGAREGATVVDIVDGDHSDGTWSAAIDRIMIAISAGIRG